MKTIDGVEKPLEEWALQEVKKMCEKGCDYCCLQGKYICDCSPRGWDLSEKKKFTEQEIEDAKAVKRILGNGSLYKDNYGLFWTSGFNSIRLNPRLFPSISIGEKIILLDIIGDADA